MARNFIKVGLLDQRDRGRKRGRSEFSERSRHCENGETSGLIEWLRERSLPPTGELSLNRYLQETNHFRIPHAERLRQLAIYLEDERSLGEPEAGWNSLKKIYEFALRLEPDSEWLLASLAVLSAHCAERTDEARLIDKIAGEGIQSGSRAIDLGYDSCRFGWLVGYLYYLRQDLDQASKYYILSITGCGDLESKEMARLYLAHCYHDQGLWMQALVHYQSVDRSIFTGFRSWRLDVLKEQIAECKYEVGNISESRDELDGILTRYERESRVAEFAMSHSFWNLVGKFPELYLRRAEMLRASSQQVMDVNRPTAFQSQSKDAAMTR